MDINWEKLEIEESDLVTYTAIFGKYDELKNIETNPKNMKLVCFTDGKIRHPGNWQIIYVQNHPFKNARIAAKFFKLKPHIFFPKIEKSIGIDGSIKIFNDDFFNYARNHLLSSNFSVCRHPGNSNIKQEAAASQEMSKYRNLSLQKQVDFYKYLGFPDDLGLWAGGLIFRNHNEPKIVEFMDSWWDENLVWGYQDQISLPFIAWKKNLTPKTIDLNIWKNEFFEWVAHKK